MIQHVVVGSSFSRNDSKMKRAIELILFNCGGSLKASGDAQHTRQTKHRTGTLCTTCAEAWVKVISNVSGNECQENSNLRWCNNHNVDSP